MSDTAKGSQVGTSFGPYRLTRLLGRGGMGEVYEAEDTVKDRVVALKLMSAELSSDPVFRHRMQREAHTAGKLREPHVVPIHDYGEIDGQLYIDMRLIEGVGLDVVLHQRGPLAPARAVAIVRQIASALNAAHAAGVTHRDIKPQNILIDDEDFAYLVDFGIASAVADERLTQTGSAIGTWKYMAPERFTADAVTYRADIYALGCVLFECLTGSPPYRADSAAVLCTAHLMEPIPRPSVAHPGVPRAFDEVIARGMAKDPADRYASAGDLANAAHDALSAPQQDQATAILSHNQGFPPAPPPPQYHAVTAPPPAQPWAPPAAAWPPPIPSPRSRRPLFAAAALAVVAVIAGVGIFLGTRPTNPPKPPNPSDSGGDNAAEKTTPTPGQAVPLGRLNNILLSTEQINGIMGTTNLQADPPAHQMEPGKPTLSRPECIGTLYPGQEWAYRGSGDTQMLGQTLSEPGGDHLVEQAVVVFGSADQAHAFVRNSATKWQNCAGQTVTTVISDQTIGWAFGNLTGADPVIAQPRTQVGSGWKCQHVLHAVSTLLVEVDACGPPGLTDQGSQIADQMAANAAR